LRSAAPCALAQCVPATIATAAVASSSATSAAPSGSASVGAITSAAADALPTIDEHNAFPETSAESPDVSGRRFADSGRRFADALGRRIESVSKSYEFSVQAVAMGGSSHGAITSAAADVLPTVDEHNAFPETSAESPDVPGRRFADALGRRIESVSKSYASRVSANKVKGVTLSLEELAHVNRVAGTDFGLDSYSHVSEWCPMRPSPIIAPVEAVHIVNGARPLLRPRGGRRFWTGTAAVMVYARRLKIRSGGLCVRMQP
jgi:hypothetical protein